VSRTISPSYRNSFLPGVYRNSSTSYRIASSLGGSSTSYRKASSLEYTGKTPPPPVTVDLSSEEASSAAALYKFFTARDSRK
jgi:hypothetical protein